MSTHVPLTLGGLDNLNHPHLRALSFPVEEYRRRVRAVQQEMALRDVDVLLCHTAANICYLTGFEAVLWYKYTVAAVPREGDPVLLAQDFEMPNACATAWCEDRVTYPCHGDPIPVTKDLLERRGWARKRIGIELNRWSMSVPTYLQLKDALAGATLVDATDLVDQVKATKSPLEIEVLRASAALTSAGMIAARSSVGIGRTDNDVAGAAYSALVRGGSEYMAIDPIVTVGARSSIPHSTYRRVTIGAGESVLIEVGACVHRYSSASMRAALTTPAPELARHMYEACRASVDAVVAAMRPGAVGDDIARKGDATLGAFGRDYVWHGIYGYSLGLGFPPDWNDCADLIMRGSRLALRPGMVFHVSTSLRKVGVCGVAFSETVLVTETGAEILTHVPRELPVAS
jgi:Xaa-Pro dipeptidase